MSQAIKRIIQTVKMNHSGHFELDRALKDLENWISNKSMLVGSIGYPLRVSSEAPQTLAGIREELNQARLTVWNGATDSTVYSRPAVNFQYRHVHDFHHAIFGCETDIAGEYALWAAMEPGLLRELSPEALLVLYIEHVGQVSWHETTGDFPACQQAFMLQALEAEGLKVWAIPAHFKPEIRQEYTQRFVNELCDSLS